MRKRRSFTIGEFADMLCLTNKEADLIFGFFWAQGLAETLRESSTDYRWPSEVRYVLDAHVHEDLLTERKR
jgi:hypothetical protein